jgi:hypothetical protein
MKKIFALTVMAMLIAGQAMATITYTNTITAGPYSIGGNSVQTVGEINLAGTYATGGFTFSPDTCAISHMQSVLLQGEDGYQFWFNPATGKVLVFQTATLTPAGTAVFTGTNATISPTAALDTAPVFSGTGATISPTATSSTPTFTATNADSPPTALIRIVDDTPTPTGYAVYYNPATSAFSMASGTGDLNIPVTVTGSTYTPAGTISTPAITVTGASYTPAGSVTGPAITVTGASYTPAGTVAFTGTPTTAAPLAEVGAGTSLAGIDKIDYQCQGW